MKEKTLLLLVIITLLVSSLIFALHFDSIITSDLWERERITNQILETGNFPQTGDAFVPEFNYIYAPAFDVLLAGMMLFSGLDYLTLIEILGFFVFFLLAVFSFLIARKLFDYRVATLTAILVVFMPRIFKISLQPIPETFGLIFILAILYLALEKRYKLAGLFSVFLMFFHLRSFLNVFLILALYGFSRRSWQEAKNLAYTLLFPAILLPLYYWDKIWDMLTVSPLINPFVSNWSLLQLFGILIITAVIGAIILLKEKRNYFVLAWFFAFALLFVIGILTLHPIFAFREFVMAFFAVAALSAYALLRFENIGKFVVPLAVLILVGNSLWFGFYTYPPIDNRDVAAVNFLQNSDSEIIYSGFVSGYAIPTLTEKKAVVGAFMEVLDDAEARIQDLQLFLETENPAEAAEIMQKYGTTTVLISRFEVKDFYVIKTNKEKFNSPHFNKIYANETNWVFNLTEQN